MGFFGAFLTFLIFLLKYVKVYQAISIFKKIEIPTAVSLFIILLSDAFLKIHGLLQIFSHSI